MNAREFPTPPPPPPERPPVVPPTVDSVYNQLTRRIKMAGTIFEDRVKLDLRQLDIDHRTKLGLPYVLVVPQQTQASRRVDRDTGTMLNPRSVRLIAQFDGRGSEHEYMAANDIETAERQLIFLLASWQPLGTSISSYGQDGVPPVTYAGMRIQSTRAPDVVATYQFVLNEVVMIPDELWIGDDARQPDELFQIGTIAIHVNGGCCFPPCPPEEPGPAFAVTGGGCPIEAEPDPCAPECPPVLGGE